MPPAQPIPPMQWVGRVCHAGGGEGREGRGGLLQGQVQGRAYHFAGPGVGPNQLSLIEFFWGKVLSVNPFFFHFLFLWDVSAVHIYMMTTLLLVGMLIIVLILSNKGKGKKLMIKGAP